MITNQQSFQKLAGHEFLQQNLQKSKFQQIAEDLTRRRHATGLKPQASGMEMIRCGRQFGLNCAQRDGRDSGWSDQQEAAYQEEQRQDAMQEQQYTTDYNRWRDWMGPALHAAKAGIHDWMNHSRIVTGDVNASAVTIPAGALQSTTAFADRITMELSAAGMPYQQAAGFGSAMFGAWMAWTATWWQFSPVAYPAFVAFPGPLAPPMPNVPFPVMNPAVWGMNDPMGFNQLSGRLYGAVSQSGGSLAVKRAIMDGFAAPLSDAFRGWQLRTPIVQVLGTGPIPTFAPPYVPVGPVVGGSCYSMGCPFLVPFY